MKKIVLTFGLISGAIMSLMLLLTIPFQEQIGFDNGMIIGYASMVLAFLLVFFGVRAYRDNVGGGRVGFGRALAVGLLISLVSSACYVVTWQIYYFNFSPDFIDKYQAHMAEKARQEGVSEEKIAAQQAEWDAFEEQYNNPLFNAAITFLEPLPVALIVALITAGVLGRRRRDVTALPPEARGSP